jgi:hypothetical protein
MLATSTKGDREQISTRSIASGAAEEEEEEEDVKAPARPAR